MTNADYPDEVDIVETNFKTDQQSDAAERIAAEWPVDMDRLAEEGQHVKMFYKQVLDQFLGPAGADATFADIKDEHGSLEQWAESKPEDGDDQEGTEPGGSAETVEEAVTASIDSATADVDDRRRAWFRAGFREGLEFALENPDLLDRD